MALKNAEYEIPVIAKLGLWPLECYNYIIACLKNMTYVLGVLKKKKKPIALSL